MESFVRTGHSQRIPLVFDNLCSPFIPLLSCHTKLDRSAYIRHDTQSRMSTIASLPSSSRIPPTTPRSATSATPSTSATASTSKPTSSIPTVDSLTSDLTRTHLGGPLGGEGDDAAAAAADPRSYKEQLLGIGVAPEADGGAAAVSSGGEGEERPSLATLLARRVLTHGGESVLLIGKERDGTDMPLSPEEYSTILSNVKDAAKEVGCEAAVLLEKKEEGKAWIMLRLIPTAPQDFVEIRVACVGNVDAGKSTTLGVLTKGGLDDGRGKARV